MPTTRIISVVIAASICAFQLYAFAQSTSQRATDMSTSGKAQPQTEGNKDGNKAEESAARIRRAIPTLPALIRGSDYLLNTEGQRATQNQLVTSANVKDPAIDAFPVAGGLPVEAAEPVQVPANQFTVALPKFYATIPVLDSISTGDWHFKAGSPELSLRHGPDGMRGFRSATPGISATGPLAGSKLLLFQGFEYRLSKTSVHNLFDERQDTRYQSYDWNTHFEIKASRRHSLSTRLALFSQELDFAGLGGLITVEATPNYLMGGGQLFFSDAYTSTGGAIVSSSLSVRKLRLHVLPQGDKPMEFIEQGELRGNYFDTMHRSSSRGDWREAVRLPELNELGRHQFTFGAAFARSSFNSSHFSRTIILRGEDDDELTSITNFAGSPFESLAVNETTLWAEDKWALSSRASFTLGLRHDWTTLSRSNEWSPRLGFVLLPLKNTVVRGGVGVFYDIMPLTAGTFTSGRQRVVQFFAEGVPTGEPRTLSNVTSREHLKTSSVLGWNFEIDREVSGRLFLRAKVEERSARNVLVIRPNLTAPRTTAILLADDGKSRYRELETTATYRLGRSSTVNFSYIRSTSDGDQNAFSTVLGTFEKSFIGTNRHARSRSDTPNRFLAWGEVQGPWRLMLSPGLDVHSGFPFSFTDASNHVAPEADFGRYPRSASLDFGLHRDFDLSELGRNGKVRLGVRIFNLTNHFNPRGVDVTEDETEKSPVLRGFFDSPGRTYRATLVVNF